MRWTFLYVLLCKIPQFLPPKLPIPTTHHTFLESRDPEVTENLYYVLSNGQSQISISLGSSLWTMSPCARKNMGVFEVVQSDVIGCFSTYIFHFLVQ